MVFVLSFVFSVSSVSAMPGGNGKGHGKPDIDNIEEDIGVASAASAVSPFPTADFSKKPGKATVNIPCIVVEAGKGETRVFKDVVMDQRGKSLNFGVVKGEHVPEVEDCEEFGLIQEFEDE